MGNTLSQSDNNLNSVITTIQMHADEEHHCVLNSTYSLSLCNSSGGSSDDSGDSGVSAGDST